MLVSFHNYLLYIKVSLRSGNNQDGLFCVFSLHVYLHIFGCCCLYISNYLKSSIIFKVAGLAFGLFMCL